MKIINAAIPVLLVLVLLTSCGGPASTPTPQISYTNTFEAALSAAYTEFAEIQMDTPTVTPVATGFPTIPSASFTMVPPAADEQVYLDPQGWYYINFPADMQPGDKPGSFTGGDYLLETGYLPYMSKPINLCLWLANVEAKPEQSGIDWMPPCSVTAKTENWYTVAYKIYENPLADPEHRFIYVKAGKRFTNSISSIKHTVTWLKTAPGPISASAALTSEEFSFWENPDTKMNDASIIEYTLPPEAQVGPTMEELWRFVPEERQLDWEAIRDKYAALPKEPTVEEQLNSLGYELKIEAEPYSRKQLFRDGRLLFDDVLRVHKVYKFSTDSGPITAFIVSTADTGRAGYYNSFLVVNDAITMWDYDFAPADRAIFAPILYQGELLWAHGTQNASVEIRRSNRNVLFTLRTYDITRLEVDSFQSWGEHWILTAGDFVVQDGKILNQKLGFEEIFEWSVVDDKPLYLFRKGARLGLSYNGKVLLLPYEDIPRGLCCAFASNNPITLDDSMYFFGQRDGVWYYVVVKFR